MNTARFESDPDARAGRAMVRVLPHFSQRLIHEAITRKCGPSASILLAALIDHQPHSWEAVSLTADELHADTGLTRREQETARRRLREAGLLRDWLAGLPARLWFLPEWEAIAAFIGEEGGGE